MTRMRLGVSAGIIALIIFVAFALSVPHTTRDVAVKKAPVEASPIPVVALRDAYKKGVHTFSGSLMVPNACTPITAAASLAGTASSSQSVAIVITAETATGTCLQVPTKVTFQTTLTAPSQLPLAVTVNGVVASTTPL
jgi:hypothetical protein